jgi:hypothetical protein
VVGLPLLSFVAIFSIILLGCDKKYGCHVDLLKSGWMCPFISSICAVKVGNRMAVLSLEVFS